MIEALATLHGRPNRHQHSAGLQPGCELKEPHSVLDSLVRVGVLWLLCHASQPVSIATDCLLHLLLQVRTILSQNTTDVTSARAYTSLKQSFPSWELVRTAAPGVACTGWPCMEARTIGQHLQQGVELCTRTQAHQQRGCCSCCRCC